MSTRRTMAQWREILNVASPAQRASVFKSNARVKRELSQYYHEVDAVPAVLVYGPFPLVLRKWHDCPREQSPAFAVANAFAAQSARRVKRSRRRTRDEMITARPRQQHSMRHVLENAYDYDDSVNNGTVNPFDDIGCNIGEDLDTLNIWRESDLTA